MTKTKHGLILALMCLTSWSRAETDVEPASKSVSISELTDCIREKGFFIAGDLGIISNFAVSNTAQGQGAQLRSAVGFSVPNAFIGLMAGYDFSPNFGLALKLANANIAGGALSRLDLESPNSFSIYLLDVNLMAAFNLTSRLRMAFNGFGGVNIVSPAPVMGGLPLAANVGLNAGLLFDTYQDGIVIGINVGGYAFINIEKPFDADRAFFAASVAPVVKYVF